ncbi:hypothetical protein J2852_003570 [Azospirillum soli]|nr:hypothetical protein [Azospirillum soli]
MGIERPVRDGAVFGFRGLRGDSVGQNLSLAAIRTVVPYRCHQAFPPMNQIDGAVA